MYRQIPVRPRPAIPPRLPIFQFAVSVQRNLCTLLARWTSESGGECRGLSRLRKCSDASAWQYLILANGARGRAAVALIQQAIANPHLFHFGELIDHENIAALDGTCSHCFATRVSSRAAKVFARPDGLFVLRVKGSRAQAEKGEEGRKHVPCWCQVRGFWTQMPTSVCV